MGHFREMLPPCDKYRKRQPLSRQNVPERASSGVIETVFLIPRDLNSHTQRTFACLDDSSLPHCTCSIKEKKAEQRAKQNRKGVMSSLKCPFLSASIFLMPCNYLQLCLSSSWGIDSGEHEGSSTVALPRLAQKASFCQYHCASPALLTLLNRFLLRDTFSGEA